MPRFAPMRYVAVQPLFGIFPGRPGQCCHFLGGEIPFGFDPSPQLFQRTFLDGLQSFLPHFFCSHILVQIQELIQGRVS